MKWCDEHGTQYVAVCINHCELEDKLSDSLLSPVTAAGRPFPQEAASVPGGEQGVAPRVHDERSEQGVAVRYDCAATAEALDDLPPCLLGLLCVGLSGSDVG